MSEKDEQHVDEEEAVETTSEQDDTPDTEGHKWAHEAEKFSDPGKTFKTS
jgi:hypothetical protein